VRHPGCGEERRVVQVDEREAVAPHQLSELVEVGRKGRDLASQDQPAQPLVRAVPDVREDRDLAGVHLRAGVGEQVRRRPLRAEDVRLEAVVEVADQLREARRCTAELRPVVHVQDRDALAPGRDPSVDRLDPARVLRGVEVQLGVRARCHPEAAPPLVVAQQLLDGAGEDLRAEALDQHPGLAGHDDASARARAGRHHRDAARGRLDHRPAELRALRGRHDHVARLVEVGRVLRERDEPDDVGELEFLHHLLRLGLVVARQVGELEASPDHGAEELLAADGAADDEVARVDPAVAQERSGLDELAKPLRRVDEAEERDHRKPRREAERGLRLFLVAGAEALEVDGVRHDRRANAEHAGDVVVDRDRGRGQAADGLADQLRAPVAAALGER
jgi:hypothetical protein